MHRFNVWAPLAIQMRVRVNERVFSMNGPDMHGWWGLEVEGVGSGTEYGYYIDDDPRCYPDPRSYWQPNGVHKLSQVYDHRAFAWTCSSFAAPPLTSGVVYELHVGTFTDQGTLDAAIEKLRYLADLGITHVELMPIASFEGRHGWGYDGVSLYSVHQAYGGPDALKRFVDAAHNIGLAVLLDVVYNHFGPSGNYAGKFGMYQTDAHSTPWGGAVNLEGSGSDQVRRFFCDNAIMWMRDYRIDGLRLDAVHAFVDRSAIHFLEQLSLETEALGATLARHLVLIAESDLNDPRIVTSRAEGGLGIHAQWSDDFHHALFTVLSPGTRDGYYADFGRISQLAKALQNTFVYDGLYSKYRKRNHGRAIDKLSQLRFLGYIQNHDQIGNRALGDRINSIVGFDRARIAAALVLLGPFIPLLFQGEEWASSSPFLYFADHDDPGLARAVSEGRKKEFSGFGWDPFLISDPESVETFKQSKLRWHEADQDEHASMLQWYRQLIQLRRTAAFPGVGAAAYFRVDFNDEEQWLGFAHSELRVICNLGKSERSFYLPTNSLIILASHADVQILDASLVLPPDSIAITRERE